MSNKSTVPTSKNLEIQLKLSSFECCVDDIVKIIKSLSPIKSPWS